MSLSRSTCMYAFMAVIAFHLLRKILHTRREAQAQHKQACFPPRQYPHKDPVLGIDIFIDTILATLNGNSFTYFQSLFDRYGKSFQVNSWGRKSIYTMDSDNIHTILVTSARSFAVEPARILPTEGFLGRGIFNTDGLEWERARALIKPIFARAQISNLDALEARMDILLAMIPRDGATIDLLPLLKRLSLDSSTEFIFGQSVNTLEPGNSEFNAEKFLASFDIALQGIGLRVMLGRLAFLQGLDKGWRKACGECHAFIDQHVDQAIENVSDDEHKSDGRYILLNELVKKTQDRMFLRTQLLNIFLPARDQTAIAIGNVFFHLARHSRVWSRLREEVLAYDGTLTFESLKHLKYVKSVVNESLRLLAPSGRNIRMCTQDCILPSGGGLEGKKPLLVQKGTEVMFVFRSMHADTTIWGEDAEVFRPERWENMEPTQLRAYIPFSAGARVCPAQQMVLNECSYILARFVREFKEIANRDAEERFVEQHKLQMESRNGVKVGFVG